MKNVAVFASDENLGRYRDLLRERWTLASVDQSAGLTKAIIEDSLGPVSPLLLTEEDTAARRALADLLATVAGDVPEPLRRTPARTTPSKARLAARAALITRLLTLQHLAVRVAKVTVVDPEGFLRDCQSLLFQVTLLFLAPELQRKGLLAEHDRLLRALDAHVMLVWRRDVAHAALLSALLQDHRHDVDASEAAFAAAFAAANPADHDYLTRAHLLWSSLLDHGKLPEARAFCLDLYRSAPADMLPEVAEMLEATLARPGAKMRAVG